MTKVTPPTRGPLVGFGSAGGRLIPMSKQPERHTMTDIDRAIDGLAEAIVQPFADLVEILREMVADNDEPDPDIHHDDPFNRDDEPPGWLDRTIESKLEVLDAITDAPEPPPPINFTWLVDR